MVNCLSYALAFWSKYPKYRIVYNGDHAINVPMDVKVQGFIPLRFYGYMYFRSAFRDELTKEEFKTLEEYLQWEKSLKVS